MLQLFNQRDLEDVISRQLGITPEVRLLAQKLRNPYFQGAVKIGDPAL
jgi:hypothetical protein